MMKYACLLSILLICLSTTPSLLGSEKEESPHFTNVADDMGLSSKAGLRTALADLNNDGYLDCVLREKETDLFLNQKGRSFTLASDKARLDQPDGEVAQNVRRVRGEPGRFARRLEGLLVLA